MVCGPHSGMISNRVNWDNDIVQVLWSFTSHTGKCHQCNAEHYHWRSVTLICGALEEHLLTYYQLIYSTETVQAEPQHFLPKPNMPVDVIKGMWAVNSAPILGFVSLGPFHCARFIFVLCITVCCMHDCLGL